MGFTPCGQPVLFVESWISVRTPTLGHCASCVVVSVGETSIPDSDDTDLSLLERTRRGASWSEASGGSFWLSKSMLACCCIIERCCVVDFVTTDDEIAFLSFEKEEKPARRLLWD